MSCDVWMWLCIGAATIFFFWLAWQKYRNFNADTNDVVVYSYAFAQTMYGKFLPLYSQSGSLLGNHLNFIILAWLPVYFVWRSFYSLFLFQTVMLTVSAWPFYLLAKHVLRNERAALALGGVFLLFPTIASQHVNQLHDDQFGLPFLAFAFYFFVREDFKKFVLFMVVACLAKETITLTTAAFGVYALFLRRSVKWVATPIVFSAVYLVAAITLLTSVFAGAGAVLYTGTKYLDAYGKSPTEVLMTFVTKPGFVLETMFSPEKREYLAKLLLPVLYLLPFFSLSVLVSLPNLLLNLVGSNVAMTVIAWHYNSILGATLLVSSVFGLKKISDRMGEKGSAVVNGLAALMLVLALVGASFWFRAEDYKSHPQTAALRRVLADVPPDASVLCPTPMLAHFSDHPRVNSAYSIFIAHNTPEELQHYDYVVLDGNWRAYEAIGQVPLVEALRSKPAYQVVFMENNVAVLRRNR